MWRARSERADGAAVRMIESSSADRGAETGSATMM